MDLELDLGQWIVIVICAILIFGYIFGYFHNRRKAAQIAYWLHEGLEEWGTIGSDARLPGMASGGRLEVQRASPPLKQIEAVYLLAPRENLLFWIFFRLQGRQDELFLWLTFQSKPPQSIEIARPGDRQLLTRLNAPEPTLKQLESGRNLLIAAEPPTDSLLVNSIQTFAQKYPKSLIRLSLRRNKPHLFVRLRLSAMQIQSARELLKELSRFSKSDQSQGAHHIES